MWIGIVDALGCSWGERKQNLPTLCNSLLCLKHLADYLVKCIHPVVIFTVVITEQAVWDHHI